MCKYQLTDILSFCVSVSQTCFSVNTTEFQLKMKPPHHHLICPPPPPPSLLEHFQNGNRFLISCSDYSCSWHGWLVWRKAVTLWVPSLHTHTHAMDVCFENAILIRFQCVAYCVPLTQSEKNV